MIALYLSSSLSRVDTEKTQGMGLLHPFLVFDLEFVLLVGGGYTGLP